MTPDVFLIFKQILFCFSSLFSVPFDVELGDHIQIQLYKHVLKMCTACYLAQKTNFRVTFINQTTSESPDLHLGFYLLHCLFTKLFFPYPYSVDPASLRCDWPVLVIPVLRLAYYIRLRAFDWTV